MNIFMHIPKTGGVSIMTALPDIQVVGHNWRGSDYVHLATILTNYDVHQVKTFTFGFVRDPYDRIASSYYYLMRGGMNWLDQLDADFHVKLYKDFEQFVLMGLEKSQTQVHFRPQVDYITHRGKFLLDFTGRYENLDKDFKKVCKLMGVKPTKLGVYNTTDYPEKVKYTAEMKQVVSRLYREDFEQFYT